MVLSRWQGWLAATVATLLTTALVIGEITDEAMRRWWSGHALTTDTVSGLLVLLITLLVIDQVVRLRQIKNRSRAVAAQAAIILTQATRAAQAVSKAITQGASSGDRDDASGEFRTYMNMLLTGSPILIDEPVSRNFLEQAQRLGGEMARALTEARKASSRAPVSPTKLNDAVRGLRSASAPMLAVLDPADQAAILGDESGLPVRLPGSSGMTTLGASHSSRSAPRGRPQQTGRGHRNEGAELTGSARGHQGGPRGRRRWIADRRGRPRSLPPAGIGSPAARKQCRRRNRAWLAPRVGDGGRRGDGEPPCLPAVGVLDAA